MTRIDTAPPVRRGPATHRRFAALAGIFTVVLLAALAGAGPAAAATAVAAPIAGLPGGARTSGALTLAPANPSAANEQRTFGIQPASRTKPDARSRFTYSATPGAALTDYVAVSNVSSATLTLRLYASDAFNTTDGGFDLLPRTRKPVDAGAWVVLRSHSVTLKPRARAIVPFRLAIPANATPGDHAAGVVASLTSVRVDAKGNRVTLDQRVGTRIYLRISGPLQARLQVTGLTSAYRNTANPSGCGAVDVRYTVRNTGNVRLGGRQVLAVRGMFGLGRDHQSLPDLPELLPGNSIAVAGSMNCVRPAVRVTATVHVYPVPTPGEVDPAAAPTAAHRGLWALPWLLFGVIPVLLAGAGWIIWRRRRGPATPAPVPPAPTAPVADPVGVGDQHG